MYPTRGGLQFASELNRLFPETKEQEYDSLLSPSIYNSTTPSYSTSMNNSSSSQELSPDSISVKRFDYTQFGKSRLQEYAELSQRVIDGRIFDKPEITNEHARNAHNSSNIGFQFPRTAFENSKESYDISDRIWNMDTFSDTVKGNWDTGLGFETPKRMWDTEKRSETPNKIWNSQMGSETPNRIWNSQMGSETPNRIWTSQMGSETPNRIVTSQMGSETPNRIWNSQMGSETPNRIVTSQMGSESPNRIWNSQMDSVTPNRIWNSQRAPVGNLDMSLESPERIVETEIGWETPKRSWNSENGSETSRRYWDMDMETQGSYRNMKMGLDIPKKAYDNPKTIFEMLRGTVEGTKSGSNIQRKVNGDANSIYDLSQRNSNAKPAFEMPRRVSLCDSDDFSTWQPLDPVQLTRSSTPNQFYELFPSPKNSYFSSKNPLPPTSLHRSQSQVSMNSWNSPQNLHDYSLDRSLDQNSLLNYSFSTSSVYDGPPPCLNIIKPNYICTFCRKNGETPSVYTSHVVKVKDGRRTIVTCPILRSLVCTICHQSGDNAHTITYCPELRKRNNGQPLTSTTVTLKNTRVKSNGRRRY